MTKFKQLKSEYQISFFKAISVVGGCTGLSRIVGLLRDILISHLVGASMIADAFWLSAKVPSFFRHILAEGAFNAVFVPLFSGKLATEGREKALQSAQNILSFLLVTLLIVTIFFELIAPWFIPLIFPGLLKTPERLQLTITFSQLTFPYIAFISLVTFFGAILNCFDRFATAAAVPILLNVILCIGAILAGQLNLNAGYTLCYAVLIGGVIQVTWIYLANVKLGIKIKLVKPKITSEIKELLKLMGPAVLGSGMMQLNLLTNTFLASMLPIGSVSYLVYADRLNQFPLAILGTAVGTALLPLLSKQLRAKQYKEALHNQNVAIQFGMQLTFPAMMGLIILSYPLIDVIYGHGKFTHSDVLNTSLALSAFAFGLPGYVLGKIFSTSFFAFKDTRTPVKIGLVGVVSNLVISLSLMNWLGHVGMAMATACSAWINMACLAYFLRKKNFLQIPKKLFIQMGKLFFSSTIMSASVYFLYKNNLHLFSNDHIAIKAFSTIGLVLIGIVIFLVITKSLKALYVDRPYHPPSTN